MTPLTGARSVAVADFRERVRTPKLLVVSVLIAYVAKLATVDATLAIAGDYTGVPTAAWYGGAVAGAGTTMLLLFGYTLVVGSIERDRRSGVDELVATSPLPSWAYLLGKWLSNVAVLTVATVVLAVATTASFLIGGTGPVDPVALVSPFLVITLPTATVIAAVVVCFETVGVLRGSLGTAVYFVLALAAIIGSVPPNSPLDLTGLVLLRESMGTSLAAQYPSFEGAIESFAYQSEGAGLKPFEWGGLRWSVGLLATRVPVVLVAAGFLTVAGLAFDRFDDTGGPFGLRERFGDTGSPEPSTVETVTETTADGTEPRVSLAAVDEGGVPVWRVLTTELRMALRGNPRWWYIACLSAVAVTALAPLGVTRSLLLPVVLLLPLSVWSELGTREHRYRTTELVFVNGTPDRLLVATYAAGAAVGVVLAGPALVRFGVAGQWWAFVGGAGAVAFLPSAALATGIWSERQGVFEIGYLVSWYLGPMNGLVPLDYTAALPATGRAGVPVVYLLLAGVGLVVAAVGRRRQARLP